MTAHKHGLLARLPALPRMLPPMGWGDAVRSLWRCDVVFKAWLRPARSRARSEIVPSGTRTAARCTPQLDVGDLRRILHPVVGGAAIAGAHRPGRSIHWIVPPPGQV
jgi:hypothetical protein